MQLKQLAALLHPPPPRLTVMSVYRVRKRKRTERYLSGTARAPYRLEKSLESSFSSCDSSPAIRETDAEEGLSEGRARKQIRREENVYEAAF